MTCSWMHRSAQLLFLAAAALTPTTKAVLYGDEIYQDIEGGKFWAFYSGGIAVIDPQSCLIETTITQDHNGEPLPGAFNDGVYMQSKNDEEGYILIGSRVDETNNLGDVVSHMYAVSTNDRKVITKAQVGPRVVHSYGVYPQNEFWMHSDGNGLFYVIDLDDLNKAAHDDIEAKVENPAHGKLLWDESAKLGNRGFATSTGETYLFEIDLTTKKQTMAYDFSAFNVESCRGLHAIAYSELNEHVYAECSGGGAALEFDVSGGSIEFVQQFKGANGAMYETPDGRFVVASSKGTNALYVFVPQGTGSKSSVEYEIRMEGHPSTVSFYTNDSDETIVCSPLTENLNQNQRREDGSIACGYYEGCTGAVSVRDVDNGICLHDADDELKLLRITEEDAVEATLLQSVCARCQNAINFVTNEDETSCVCTPQCGSCDPNPSYSDDESGYMCVNLSAYVKAETTGGAPIEATLIPNTGGMYQGTPYGGSAECSFGRTYRTHKRGTKYDAAVSNVPNHSIVIIDMDKMQKKCTVDLPDKPSKVVYAPDGPVRRDALTAYKETSDAAAMNRSVESSLAMVILGTMLCVFGANFVV